MPERCTPADLFHHRTIGGLSGSTGHGRLAFEVHRARKASDKYERVAWVLDDFDDKPRAFTSSAHSATSPRWNPDGTVLAFISSRGDAGRQVHLLRVDGGEATQLTHAKETLSRIEGWTPDGKRLLLSARHTWNRDAGEPHVIRFLPYRRDGAGVIVGKRKHLYAVDVATGELTALTEGDFDVTRGLWSEDGRRLAYVRRKSGRQRHRNELWIARGDGSHAQRRVDSVASISRLAWSPDGKRIAFGGHEEAGDPMENLWLLDVDGDAPPRRLVSHEFELDPASGIAWHPDGTRIAVTCLHRGVSRLAFVSIPDGELHTVDRGLKGVTECGAWGDRIAFVSVSMRRHEELHSVDWHGGDERRHTSLNRWFRKRDRPNVSLRSFDVPDGEGGTERIRAWLLLPKRGTKPYPLLVDMHGGPHSNVRTNYAAHTYWYALLGEGWAIVAPDAVGSTGYGRDFVRRLRGHWGERDLPQYEAVVHALADEGLVDLARVACAGKSYGGFLSAWAIGHGDLFRAAVISAPVSNVVSHFGTSDSGYYVTPWLVGCEFVEDRERWRAQNTIEHLHRATTPTLILQGEDDARCPRGQAEEVFAHLVRETDVPVDLVLYPGGTHGLAERGRPSHRLDYHQRICDWVLRWLGARDEIGEARERRRA